MRSRLLLLPGIGADRRLFDAQRSCAADVQVVEWIRPVALDEPLTEYAKRLAATIDTSEPFVLGGASFGGMVALELARSVRPKAVILIGSCRSPSALPPSSRFLGGAGGLLPHSLLGRLFLAAPLIASRFGVASAAHRQLFVDMLRSTQPSFVRWAVQAIFGWRGAGELSVPIHHIHGDTDRIIPLRSVQPDLVVAGAGHILSVTHPAEVNAFLDAVMSGVDSGGGAARPSERD